MLIYTCTWTYVIIMLEIIGWTCISLHQLLLLHEASEDIDAEACDLFINLVKHTGLFIIICTVSFHSQLVAI